MLFFAISFCTGVRRWGTKYLSFHIISFCPADTHGLKLKTPSETRATMVTKLWVCPRPQRTEPATLSCGTVVSMICKPLPFLWIRIHTGDPQEHKLWVSQSRWTLLQLHSRETERQHTELTQDGCWCQVKSPVPCWSNVAQLQGSVILTKMPKCTHGVSFTRARKMDETQLPLKSAGALAPT